jgi:predicted nucleotidyltransferase
MEAEYAILEIPMTRVAQTLLQELKAGLGALYGNRLRGVYLFGSYARGEEDRESDVDVLVILDDVRRYADEVDRTGALGSQLSLKYGVSISQVFMRESDWLRGETPFLANVREEAVTV